MHHLITGALVALTATAAHAQNCGPRADIEELVRRYDEQQVYVGSILSTVQPGTITGIFELFHNPETGSWTVVLTMPDGSACIPVVGTQGETRATGLPL
jgi:hypothetical protein